MRLYLSSYLLGEHPETFAGLVRGARRGWLVTNALDGGDEARRSGAVTVQRTLLAGIGLEAADLDLRRHSPSTLAKTFGEPDFVWVRGGNVFTLRMAMARSGLDEIVRRGIAADAFVYAGFSAGACVLAPTLRGLEVCDPVGACAAVYGSFRFDGLGVLDRPVVPHLDSPGHPESAVLADVARTYAARGQDYWGLRDGQALVVNGPVGELALIP